MNDITQRCAACGAPVLPGNRFCTYCGTAVPAAPRAGTGRQARGAARRWYRLWWVWLLIVLPVLAISGCSWAAWRWRVYMGRAPHRVLIGQQLAWRELKTPPDPNMPRLLMPRQLMFFKVAVGDFDGDGSGEVLVTGGPSSASLIEADGSARLLPQQAHYVPYRALAWDYNSDGVDELMADDYQGRGVLAVDVQGQELGTLPGCNVWGATCVDFDGDGRLDFATEDEQRQAVVVFQPGGQELWRMPLPAHCYNPAYGDVDGDGKAEVVVSDNGTLRIFGAARPEAQLKGWSGYYWPALIADLNGDTRGEIFASNSGYLDPATQQFTAFKYGRQGTEPTSDPLETVLACDLNRDGTAEIVTKGLNSFVTNSRLFVLKQDGSCSYDERMGHPIEQLLKLHTADGVDHIVVLTEVKLLIYP